MLEPPSTVEPAIGLVRRVFATFANQDSGCVSWGVETASGRWFVKAATTDAARASLARAAAFHAAVRHVAIVAPAHRVGDGRVLVYPWVDGDPLYGIDTAAGSGCRGPGSAHARFRALDVIEILDALDAIFDAHLAVAAARFVSVDLYDGCFVYDFDRRRMHLIDFDEYRPGPFVVNADRLPGSTRFMAPEELRRGGVIDERTMVFHLGRTAHILLDEGDAVGRWRASGELRGVATRATAGEPSARFGTVAGFVDAWRGAL